MPQLGARPATKAELLRASRAKPCSVRSELAFHRRGGCLTFADASTNCGEKADDQRQSYGRPPEGSRGLVTKLKPYSSWPAVGLIRLPGLDLVPGLTVGPYCASGAELQGTSTAMTPYWGSKLPSQMASKESAPPTG